MRRDSFLGQVLMAVARVLPAGERSRSVTKEGQSGRPASQLLMAIARATPAFTPGSGAGLAAQRTSQKAVPSDGISHGAADTRGSKDLLEFEPRASPYGRPGSYRQALIVALAALAVPVVLAALILIKSAVQGGHAPEPITSASSLRPTPTVSPHCTTGSGFIRFGDFSPASSSIDVYLYSFGNSSARLVLHDLRYGTVSSYMRVNACNYSIGMLTAGSPASSQPILAGIVVAKANHAYTVAALEATSHETQLKILDDTLITPSGYSLVRVIQASINQRQVTFHCSCASGANGDVTTNAPSGSVTPYYRIPPAPGSGWTMTATGPTAAASLSVMFDAGTVYTEVVIDESSGIEILNLVDAVDGQFSPSAAVTVSPSPSRSGPLSSRPRLWAISAGLPLQTGLAG